MHDDDIYTPFGYEDDYEQEPDYSHDYDYEREEDELLERQELQDFEGIEFREEHPECDGDW